MGMHRIDRNIDCPWCGNQVAIQGILNSQSKEQKCKWCRRLFIVNTKFKSNKVLFEAKTKDFLEPERDPVYPNQCNIPQSGLGNVW